MIALLLACTGAPVADTAAPAAPTPAKVTTPDEAIASIAWNNQAQTDMARSWPRAPSPEAQHLAQAWLLYAQLEAHDPAAATTWAALSPSLAGYPHEWPATPTIGEALFAIRFLSESTDTGPGASSPMPCSVLGKHPESRAAFGSVWGSSKDHLAASMRQACVPSDPAFDKAFADFMKAIEAASPLPDGTMYQSMAMSSYEPIQWALIDPVGAKPTGGEIEARDKALAASTDAVGLKSAADALSAAMVPLVRKKDPTVDARSVADASVAAALTDRLSVSEGEPTE